MIGLTVCIASFTIEPISVTVSALRISDRVRSTKSDTPTARYGLRPRTITNSPTDAARVTEISGVARAAISVLGRPPQERKVTPRIAPATPHTKLATAAPSTSHKGIVTTEAARPTRELAAVTSSAVRGHTTLLINSVDAQRITDAKDK